MPLGRYQKYIVTIVPVLFVGLICYYFSNIVAYIILAWILSMVGAPVYLRLKKYVGNTLAALGTLTVFGLIFIGVLWMFIPPIVQQTRNFTKIDYTQLAQNLEEPINDWKEWLIKRGILQPEDLPTVNLADPRDELKDFSVLRLDSLLVQNGDTSMGGITLLINIHPEQKEEKLNPGNGVSADGFFDQVRERLFTILNPARVTQVFGSLVGLVGNVVVTLMSTFFIAFFFLKEQGLFTKMIRSLVPNESEDNWSHAIDESAKLLMRYFIGILLQITIITIFMSLILSFLGFKNALLIGFFAALMNVIPYIGPILGASFGIIISVASGYDMPFYTELLPSLGILILVFGVMQLLDNFIVQPNIFSKSVKAHPLEIFIVVLVGAQIHGILGMVLAIPIYTVIRVLAKVFLSEFKIVQKITQRL